MQVPDQVLPDVGRKLHPGLKFAVQEPHGDHPVSQCYRKLVEPEDGDESRVSDEQRTYSE